MMKKIKYIKYTTGYKKEIKTNQLMYKDDSLKTDLIINKKIILNVLSETNYEIKIFIDDILINQKKFSEEIFSIDICIPIKNIEKFYIEIENDKEKEIISILEDKNEINYELNKKILNDSHYGLKYLKYYWNNKNSWVKLIEDFSIFIKMDIVEFIIEEERIEDLEDLKEYINPFNNVFIRGK